MRKIGKLHTVLAASLCFFAMGCEFNGKYVEELDWTLDAAAIETIDVETTHGSIEVAAGDVDQITIHAVKTILARTDAKAEEFSKRVTLHVTPENDVLRIYKKQPAVMNNYGVGVSYTIECPPGVALKLASTHGKIEMKGVQDQADAETTHGAITLIGGKGQIDLRTSHAPIIVQNCEGRIEAKTSHGEIRLKDAAAEGEDVFLRTTHAAVHIEDCQGNFDVQTSHGAIVGRRLSLSAPARFASTHGRIELEIDRGSAPVFAGTTHSSIALTLPKEYSGRLDASTSHGRIETDFPIPVLRSSKDSLAGPIGEGGEAIVRLRSSHGNISIQRQ
ncbi:MAG: DUF4097 family beta strand repeat protein [Candidatus Omnitrophica bacterium]|nr:DUF4097 family beta strand repeat protein [Candidatus Omnitrophota bacterium]